MYNPDYIEPSIIFSMLNLKNDDFKDATPEDVLGILNKAYKKRSLTIHPDKGGNEDDAKQLNLLIEKIRNNEALIQRFINWLKSQKILPTQNPLTDSMFSFFARPTHESFYIDGEKYEDMALYEKKVEQCKQFAKLDHAYPKNPYFYIAIIKFIEQENSANTKKEQFHLEPAFAVLVKKLENVLCGVAELANLNQKKVKYQIFKSILILKNTQPDVFDFFCSLPPLLYGFPKTNLILQTLIQRLAAADEQGKVALKAYIQSSFAGKESDEIRAEWNRLAEEEWSRFCIDNTLSNISTGGGAPVVPVPASAKRKKTQPPKKKEQKPKKQKQPASTPHKDLSTLPEEDLEKMKALLAQRWGMGPGKS